MDEENIKYTPEAGHQHLQSQEREQEFAEKENFMADIAKLDQIDQDYWPLMYPGFQFIDGSFDNNNMQSRLQKGNFFQIDQDFWTRRQEIFQKSKGNFSQIDQDFWTREQEPIRKRESNFSQIDQGFRTPVQERLQKKTDKTTKTTKSRHSTITSVLLGSVSVASRFCSVGADFIPVESDLSLCKTDLSKLANTCDHDEGKAIQCVLNDEGELGIGCFSKIWVEERNCPYFRNSFGVLDIRPCLGNSSICPTDRDRYLSNEVYKYPGCLINSSTRVLDILATETTQSTTIRSSDEGDKETMLLILVVIFGLISLTLLLIHGLRFLRPMKITLRGLRSAYAPASMGQQDPQRDGLPDDGDDV